MAWQATSRSPSHPSSPPSPHNLSARWWQLVAGGWSSGVRDDRPQAPVCHVVHHFPCSLTVFIVRIGINVSDFHDDQGCVVTIGAAWCSAVHFFLHLSSVAAAPYTTPPSDNLLITYHVGGRW